MQGHCRDALVASRHGSWSTSATHPPSSVARRGGATRRLAVSLYRSLFARLRTSLLTLVLGAVPGSAVSQTDPSTLHATNADWVEHTWLLLLDGGAPADGRLTDRGVLLRFHPNIDEEYWIDFVSSQPGLTEQYEWWNRKNGARYWGGSVNHLRLVAGGDFKARAPLGRGWTAQAKFTYADYEELTRALVRIGFEKRWRSGAFTFLHGTLPAVKPEMDLELGVGISRKAIAASVSLTALDVFNDVIFEGLDVFEGFADTAVAYRQFPWAVRSRVRWSPVSRIRLEADAAVVVSSSLTAFRQLAPDTGFTQEKEFAFVGLLGEYAVSPRVRTGAFLQWVRAETDRAPLLQGDPLVDYLLTERTTRAGAYVLVDLGDRWRSETWLVRELRPETRIDRSGPGGDVDYEDRSWLGSTTVEYRPRGGFRAHAAFEMDVREVIRGSGQVPTRGQLGVHNFRLRFDVGWQFGRRFLLLGGYRLDLDTDPQIANRPGFDGAHGRFTMYW